MVKSHEFISKTVMKNFATKQGKDFYTFYMHPPNKMVHYGNINTVNVKKDAYTDENEAALCRDFETHIGDIQAAFMQAHKRGLAFDVSCVDSDKVRKYFAYQYWRDDTFVEELATAAERQFGELTDLILDGHAANDIAGLKNLFIAEESALQTRNPAFNNSHISVGVDTEGRLLGHSYPITITNDAHYLVNAIALSPHLIFIQLHYKHPDKNALSRIYINKPNAFLLTEQQVHNLNSVMVNLSVRLQTGYIVSKERCLLMNIINEARKFSQ